MSWLMDRPALETPWRAGLLDNFIHCLYKCTTSPGHWLFCANPRTFSTWGLTQPCLSMQLGRYSAPHKANRGHRAAGGQFQMPSCLHLGRWTGCFLRSRQLVLLLQ